MARRRTAKKPRRRTQKPMIKAIPIVAGVVSANALTQLFFNNNLRQFFTGTSGDGSQHFTLRELFGAGGISNYGIGGGGKSFGEYVKQNIADGWMTAAGTLILAKAVPKIIQKVGITREANKLSKAVGLGTIVQL